MVKVLLGASLMGSGAALAEHGVHRLTIALLVIVAGVVLLVDGMTGRNRT